MGNVITNVTANPTRRIDLVAGIGYGDDLSQAREVLEKINLDRIKSNGYAFQIEMTFKAWKKGFRIKEISIVFTDRVKGTSKMSKKIVREAILMVWKLRLRSIFGLLN